MERRLAAILAADVAGYTQLMGQDEAGTLQRLTDLREQVLQPLIARHRGRVVKDMGDGFLLEFASVVDAVACALAWQQDVTRHEENRDESGRLVFRIGINVGDVIVQKDDIFGEGVNIAARLEGLAEPGNIYLSGEAYRNAKGRLDVAFEDLGERRLKNVADTVRVYRVGAYGDALAVARQSSRTLPLPDKPSIAVLPFINMSGDSEQEYFADGITDDLITALSNVQSFFVIARNSTFVFKGKPTDIKIVGTRLGVRYVMEGSVRKSGNRVRVTAQLVEAASARQIWASHFDGTFDEIFEFQDEITASVVGAIEPRLLEAEAKRIEKSRREDPDAYDLVLRGLDLMNRLTPEASAAALDLFATAADIDPAYGRAYASASWCYRRHVQLSGMTLSPHDRSESIRLARIALNVDGADPYVLWQAGLTAAFMERDPDAGQALIDQSLQINANANRAWIAGGIVRCMAGDPEAAIYHAERAIRLSPLDTSMWVAHGVLATACMQLARYGEAADWARRSTRRHIFNAPAFHVLAASCANLGLMEQARAAVERARELDPELTLKRLQELFMVERYENLDGFLEGLRQAGLPE